MHLTAALLEETSAETRRLDRPQPDFDTLPERVLQFGTGAFLRGFVEDFIDGANRRGQFNGRVVMVGSTGSGRADRLAEQDGLYTLWVRGLRDGKRVDEGRVIGAVSRALSAHEAWADVLACAHNPDLELVVSNTTEVGLTLDDADRLDAQPPASFPAKLTAFLLERARAFDYAPEQGLLMLPCELIEHNGDLLRRLVLTLADQWELEPEFAAWIRTANRFCNTLVDRIVPGAPEETAAEIRERFGYEDDLLTVAEPYRLWVVEGDDAVQERLAPLCFDETLIVTDDHTPYRERKVRLLNGTHTAMVPLAMLCGCETVRDAMEHPAVSAFIRRVMLDEIAPGLAAEAQARTFAAEVLDRFANPFIRHALRAITLQQTMKWRVRVVPSIVRYAEREGRAPAGLALGFAAYLRLVRDRTDLLADGQADRITSHWQETGDDLSAFVRAVCADTLLWGTDLNRVPGFAEEVEEALRRVVRGPVEDVLAAWVGA